MKPYAHKNPRISIILKHYNASPRLVEVLRPWHRWGLKRFGNINSEPRHGVSTIVFGCTPALEKEWQSLLAKRRKERGI